MFLAAGNMPVNNMVEVASSRPILEALVVDLTFRLPAGNAPGWLLLRRNSGALRRQPGNL
jgi:hypothetical protein